MPKTATPDLVPFTIPTQGWAGGVNMRDSLTSLQPDELRKGENGILDERGGFSKRLGSTSMGTYGLAADRTLSQYVFYRGTAAPQVLIHTTAGKLYYTNDPTANPIVWTQIATGLSTTAPMSYETFNGKCYFSNGVDPYASWDGATYTTFASAPKGKYLRLWKDTMFLAGVTGLPDRVYESAAGDAETWPVASWVDIGKGDGDIAKGLGSDGFTLIFFKQRRHMVITDPTTLANRVVDFEKGCESHFSIIQMEGQLYFLSRRGICRFLGDSPSEIITFKIDPLFDPNVLNLAALETSWAYTVDNRVGFALPEVGSAVPTMQVEYYPRLGQLSPFGVRGLGPFGTQRLPATTVVRYRWGGVEYLFGTPSDSNKYYKLLDAVGTDDGVTPSAIMETGILDFGSPSRSKYIRRIFIIGRGKFLLQFLKDGATSVKKTIVVDMTTGGDVWNDENWNAGTWGPNAIIKTIEVNPDIYGQFFQIRITDFETTIGKKLLDVGSREYNINAGEWAVYQMILDGNVLGKRR